MNREGDHGRDVANGSRGIHRVLTLASIVALIPAWPADAEIHDYMILRLIYLRTSCGTQNLARIDAGRADWRRFKIDCRDVASYPQGIVVTCTDLADDRSCRIDTKEKTFDGLELLQPPN